MEFPAVSICIEAKAKTKEKKIKQIYHKKIRQFGFLSVHCNN